MLKSNKYRDGDVILTLCGSFLQIIRVNKSTYSLKTKTGGEFNYNKQFVDSKSKKIESTLPNLLYFSIIKKG